jgi:hypothetical protein
MDLATANRNGLTLKWTAEKPSYKVAFCAASCTLSSKSTRYVGKGIIETCLSDDEMGYTDHSQPPRAAAAAKPPRLLDQVRDTVRRKHFSLRTEQTYVFSG